MTRLQRVDRDNARVALAVVFLLVLSAALADCGAKPAPALAQGHRWHHGAALMLSQATWHEADLEAYSDLGGIYSVVQNRRHEGETFQSAIRRVMPNLAAGTTSRSWVRGLPVGPIHRNPLGWPWRTSAARYSAAWQRLYDRAVGLVTGYAAPQCEGRPSRWFGRITDRDRLAAALGSGEWREVDCGPSQNAFLAAVDVD